MKNKIDTSFFRVDKKLGKYFPSKLKFKLRFYFITRKLNKIR